MKVRGFLYVKTETLASALNEIIDFVSLILGNLFPILSLTVASPTMTKIAVFSL